MWYRAAHTTYFLCLHSEQDVATGDGIPDNSYYKADAPSQPWASAPPAEMMDVLPGYEGIGASGGCEFMDLVNYLHWFIFSTYLKGERLFVP